MLIHVDEFGDCARLRNGLRGGNKCVRYSEYYVAGFDPAGHNGKAQCIGATADRDRVAGIAEVSKCLFKLFDHGAADESRGAKSVTKGANELMFERQMWRDQV